MIAKGDFVRLSFTAKLEDGTVIDTTDEEVAKENSIYNENARYGDIYAVVGEGHVVKGLDEDLEGKEVGYSGKVLVPPEKAFGKYDPDDKDTFSLSRFKERPEVGQRVRIGDKFGTVERIVGRRVIVDFNHPLSGKNIIFEYEIKEKLDKLEDKIKALFSIHTGVNIVDVKIEDAIVTVEVPRNAYLNQLFLIGRYRVVNDAMKLLDVKEIWIVEKFRKDEEILKFVEEVKKEEESKSETGEKSGEGIQEEKEKQKDEGELIVT